MSSFYTATNNGRLGKNIQANNYNDKNPGTRSYLYMYNVHGQLC